MGDADVLEDIKAALQRLKDEHPGALPLVISSAGLQRLVDQWGAEEARRLLSEGIIATDDRPFALIMSHRGVLVEDVMEFERWGPGPTYRRGDVVQFDGRKYMAMEAQHVELAPPPRFPAHNAPNRRRFKRSQRKR